MWKRLFWLGLSCGLLSACSTNSRKLSQVEVRQLSSVKDAAASSPARQKAIATVTGIAPACPKEIRDQFSAVASAKMTFPECPESFSKNFEDSLQFLKSDERYTLEQILKGRCRSLGLGEFGDSLEELVNNFDTTGPAGRLAGGDPAVAADGTKALEALRDSLTELVDLQLPLERWGRRYGSFVLPDEDVQYLNKLVLDQGCKLGDDDVDSAYRSIRSLEELSHILKAGTQRELVDHFLLGVHKVIDRRLQEFFPK